MLTTCNKNLGIGKSYTATGTTLTFDEAPPSGTGNVYVIYRGQAEVTTRLEAPDLSITTAKLADRCCATAKITDANITSKVTGTLRLQMAVTAAYKRLLQWHILILIFGTKIPMKLYCYHRRISPLDHWSSLNTSTSKILVVLVRL